MAVPAPADHPAPRATSTTTGTTDATTIRNNIIRIAKAQVGYKASSGQDKFGENTAPGEWCAIFVDWVYKQAGVKNPPHSALADSLVGKAKQGNPVAGDAVHYQGQHIEICVGVKGNQIQTVSGNSHGGSGEVVFTDFFDYHQGRGLGPVTSFDEPVPGGTPTSDTTTAGPGGGITAEQFLPIAKAAAFATELEFPSALEVAEAVGLQGQKSLLNDKPLLPFIQQLADASLRKFMSMPNGNAFFFFPDYFGESNHRAPYWFIDDIEVLDGTIELSDDSLATHVFVVGDTSFTHNEMLDSIWSAGTVNIFNAFMSTTGFVNHQSSNTDPHLKGQKINTLIDHNDAINFLQRYGARPLVENMPMIHSPYFEMFYAYQLFLLAWSRQFLSQFEFTFMPELFPGGKVGFPDHGLQMYIEEVSHDWDTTEGYRTSATLSAPAQMGATSQLPPDMVQAIVKPVHDMPSSPKPKVHAGSPGNVRAGQ